LLRETLTDDLLTATDPGMHSELATRDRAEND
jgi:hypothetical protein